MLYFLYSAQPTAALLMAPWSELKLNSRFLWQPQEYPTKPKTPRSQVGVSSVFERLREERGLPEVLRVDNGPEFLSGEFVAWAETAGMIIHYIQPVQPNQNAYIERFNRTYREEVLSLYIFTSLSEVREITYWWKTDYNELRPHVLSAV